jgi:lysophospholipase L1-like esterase
MIKYIKINLIIFVSLILLLELVSQSFFRIKNGRFLFDQSDAKLRAQLFEEHPYLSVALKKNVTVDFDNGGEYEAVKTTEIGTRWTGANLKDTSAIRIVCIGGSTTFCTGVSDEYSWPAILQKMLGSNYAVINYGVPAYNTVEGLIQMALYVPELKPDIVVFHQGTNDLYNYYLGDNYPDYRYHADHIMPSALLARKRDETCFEKFSKLSGIFWMTSRTAARFKEQEVPVKHSKPDTIVDYVFQRNLRNMLSMADNIPAKSIFIGQVKNPFHSNKDDNPWSFRVEPELVLPFMARMNNMAKEICQSDSLCTYYDFMNTIPWKPDHFWDSMHLTKAGNELFADRLVKVIEAYEAE